MDFAIRQGLEPKSIKHAGGLYTPLRKALLEAPLDVWLHVVVDADMAEKVRCAVTSGSNTKEIEDIRKAGFTTRTAIRRTKHDNNIPIGKAVVFFKKVVRNK